MRGGEKKHSRLYAMSAMHVFCGDKRLDSWVQFMCQWSRLVWSQDAATAAQPVDFPLLSDSWHRRCRWPSRAPLLASFIVEARGCSWDFICQCDSFWMVNHCSCALRSSQQILRTKRRSKYNRKKALCGIFLISNRKQQVSDSLFAGHFQVYPYSSWRHSEGLVPKCSCCLPDGAPPLRIPRQHCGLPACRWVANASSISLDCNSMKWSV